MGQPGWALLGLVITGRFVAWLGPVYRFLSLVGTCLFLGTVFRILNRQVAQKRKGSSARGGPGLADQVRDGHRP